MASLLEQLSEMTVVVADTGDLEAIKKFTPRDATTNPSLILAAAQIPAYQSLIDEALRSSRKLIGENAPVEEVVREALDEIIISYKSRFIHFKIVTFFIKIEHLVRSNCGFVFRILTRNSNLFIIRAN